MWTPVHVRPRCEKVVAGYCDGLGVAVYLPLRRRAKRYQRRTVETFLPMFPGYLFAHLQPEAISAVMQCNRIANLLRMNAAAEARLIGELRSLQILERANLGHQLIVAPELVAGTAVTLVSGPLRGLEGIVERRHSGARVTVNVDLLGQSVAVDLDAGEVEIVG